MIIGVVVEGSAVQKNLRVVRDHQDQRPAGVREFHEHMDHRDCAGSIEAGSGLVGNDHCRHLARGVTRQESANRRQADTFAT